MFQNVHQVNTVQTVNMIVIANMEESVIKSLGVVAVHPGTMDLLVNLVCCHIFSVFDMLVLCSLLYVFIMKMYHQIALIFVCHIVVSYFLTRAKLTEKNYTLVPSHTNSSDMIGELFPETRTGTNVSPFSFI